jgi:hypothetical protein
MQNLQVMPYNSLKLNFLLNVQSFPCPTGKFCRGNFCYLKNHLCTAKLPRYHQQFKFFLIHCTFSMISIQQLQVSVWIECLPILKWDVTVFRFTTNVLKKVASKSISSNNSKYLKEEKIAISLTPWCKWTDVIWY